MASQDLVQAYTATIRPVAEYASPVWHPQLTASQSEVLERQQTQALKKIMVWEQVPKKGAAAYQLGNTTSRAITEVKQC